MSKNRLKIIRDDLGGISQAKLESLTGIPLHKIRYAETSGAKISQEIADVLGEKLDYNKLWILTGEGPMKKGEYTQNHEISSMNSHVVREEKRTGAGASEFSIAEDLTIAAKVLESKTHYAKSLHLNIHSFLEGVESENDRLQCKEDLRKQGDQIAQMKKRLDEMETQNKKLIEEIKELKKVRGGCPPIDLGLEHAAPTGTEDPGT